MTNSIDHVKKNIIQMGPNFISHCMFWLNKYINKRERLGFTVTYKANMKSMKGGGEPRHFQRGVSDCGHEGVSPK